MNYSQFSKIKLSNTLYRDNAGVLEKSTDNGSTWTTVGSSVDLSGYAKLDGSNMPFTGNFKQVVSGVTTEISNGFLLVDSFRGIKPRISGSSMVFGDGSGNIQLSSLNSAIALGSGYIEVKGSFRFQNSVNTYISVLGSDSNGGYLELRDGSSSITNLIDGRSTAVNSATFAKSIIIGDSTSTTGGSLKYNTTTNSHQSYNGSAWQYTGGIGTKPLSSTALTPTGTHDGFSLIWDNINNNYNLIKVNDYLKPTVSNATGTVTITTSDNGKLYLPTNTTTYTLPLWSSVTAPFMVEFMPENVPITINPHATDLGTISIDGDINFAFSGGYASLQIWKLAGSNMWRIK